MQVIRNEGGAGGRQLFKAPSLQGVFIVALAPSPRFSFHLIFYFIIFIVI